MATTATAQEETSTTKGKYPGLQNTIKINLIVNQVFNVSVLRKKNTIRCGRGPQLVVFVVTTRSSADTGTYYDQKE